MKLKIKEIAIFGVLGAIIFVSKLVMEAFPNIHIIGMLIVAITVVFRAKALYPIYVFVFLNGLFSGFPLWWIPYLYVWTVLWVFVMLIPKKNAKKSVARYLYVGCCVARIFIRHIVCAVTGNTFRVEF